MPMRYFEMIRSKVIYEVENLSYQMQRKLRSWLFEFEWNYTDMIPDHTGRGLPWYMQGLFKWVWKEHWPLIVKNRAQKPTGASE